jgi:pimeloyl-ACP methyl ester carboxylesterase
MLTASPVEMDLKLPSGRLHAQRFGSASAPSTSLFLPGLTANMKSFDFLGERLGSNDLQFVALDLRGRGKSDVTPRGSYGLSNHARDVFEAASFLGAQQFSVIGHSMGAAVALTAIAMDEARRIERLVLIDLCGEPEASTGPPISAAVNRLGTVYPSVEAYLDMVKQIGTVSPWSDYWERYFRYELEPVSNGVRARTSREAALEDQAAFHPDRIAAVYATWASVRQPALLLRASRELLPGLGYTVSETDRDRFAASVPTAKVVEVDANHYGIITADATASAIRDFFASAQ